MCAKKTVYEDEKEEIEQDKYKESPGASAIHNWCINYLKGDLSYGKGNTAPVKGQKLPMVGKIESWDGKDGVLPEEEEIDLSDVDLDEKDEL